jgi:sialidase-1
MALLSVKSIFFCFFLFLCTSVIHGNPFKSEDYIFHYGHLCNSSFQLKKDKKLTIAFLGGSITNMQGWRDLVCKKLEQQYPDAEFRFINAGVPSLGSLPHSFRFENDVLSKGKIDLLFVESAVNDHANGTPELTQYRALEGIIRHARKDNPFMDIVMMAFVDPDKMTDYRNHKIPDEVAVHQKIAQYYHLPFINLAKEVTDRIDHGEFTWEKDFKDLHPSPFGQELYARTIMTFLEREFLGSKNSKQHRLPDPIDPLNYCHGHYLKIHKAEVLSGFRMQEEWIPSDNLATREGFVHVPVLEALTPGDSFRLRFEGSVIGIGILSGGDTGMLEYTVDGKEYPVMDLFTQWSNSLYLPWFMVLADDLAPGSHVLEVRVSKQHHDRSTGTAIRIVNFLEN